MHRHLRRTLATVSVTGLLALGGVACEGDDLEEGVEDVQDGAEDLGEDLEEGVEDLGEG